MNVGQWPSNWALRYPDEPCIRYQDMELTKKEFNQRVNRAAHAFAQSGVRKGDRVAGLLGNSHVFLEVLFALSKLGAVMVPLNFRLAPSELEYIANNCTPETLVYSPEFAPVAETLRKGVPSLKRFLCEVPESAPNDPDYETFITNQPDTEPETESEVTLDDPQFIMYTSGTTGRPKGAVITHGNTQWNAINAFVTYGMGCNDVIMCCAPLFHIGALNISATPALYGGAMLTIQRFSTRREPWK